MNKYKIELKWALIFTGVLLLWMVLERALGLHDEHIDKHPIFTNFFMIPAVVIYVLALRDKREQYYQGVMTYKQGFMTGLVITLILTLLAPLSQYITSTFITPQYFSNAIRYAVESGKMTQAAAEQYFNLKSYLLQVLIGTPVMGIITTAIVAFFTRKSG